MVPCSEQLNPVQSSTNAKSPNHSFNGALALPALKRSFPRINARAPTPNMEKPDSHESRNIEREEEPHREVCTTTRSVV
jgi:hypothetical protein